MHRHILLLLLSIAIMAAAAMPAPAFAGRDHREAVARRGSDTGGGTSLGEAVQQVQRDTGGRVLSAETVSQGGRAVHRIKVLLPSGRVRVVTVDAGH